MSKNERKKVQPVMRQNDGIAMGVKKTIEMRPDGQSVVAVSIDFTTAPVPDRKYVADIASVIGYDHSIKLLFGQNKLPKGLRSLLVVDMSPSAITKFVTTISEVNNPSYRDIAELTQLSTPKLTKITDEPDQTVAFKANIISSAASGEDACIDFYYISPFAMRDLATNDKVSIDPVVRVDIQVNLFVSLLEELERVVKKYPQLKEYGHG